MGLSRSTAWHGSGWIEALPERRVRELCGGSGSVASEAWVYLSTSKQWHPGFQDSVLKLLLWDGKWKFPSIVPFQRQNDGFYVSQQILSKKDPDKLCSYPQDQEPLGTQRNTMVWREHRRQAHPKWKSSLGHFYLDAPYKLGHILSFGRIGFVTDESEMPVSNIGCKKMFYDTTILCRYEVLHTIYSWYLLVKFLWPCGEKNSKNKPQKLQPRKKRTWLAEFWQNFAKNFLEGNVGWFCGKILGRNFAEVLPKKVEKIWNFGLDFSLRNWVKEIGKSWEELNSRKCASSTWIDAGYHNLVDLKALHTDGTWSLIAFRSLGSRPASCRMLIGQQAKVKE